MGSKEPLHGYAGPLQLLCITQAKARLFQPAFPLAWEEDDQLVWSRRIFQPCGPLRQTREKMPSSFLASPLAVRSR